MRRTLWKHSSWVRFGMILTAAFALSMPARLAAAEQMTTVHVQVNDAKTGDPIFQAHLTLRYRVQGGFMRRTRIVSYTAKTDKDGKTQFPVVPRGTITLMVTAPDHNTFGKEFEITRDNQLIDVKLQRPHEVL
ncbi:MAG: carboxypeptidase regulatory-like domain-containing protein [Acidobacteria bacterium]|nr:MAG: carboxypeptidase regulatory-like domain-containing protein [Acidobacteriota bacterium]